MKYYESKYTGAEVDALLGKVESGDVGGKVTVDSALSTESENPVQNKVVTEKLTELSAEVSELSERVDELEKGGQGGASVEGDTLIFSATSSAQVIGNTLKL